MFKIETQGLVNWNPVTHEIPYVDFLFLTSAKKKAEGLARSWSAPTSFGNWSPKNPPNEPNHLALHALIIEKSKSLTQAAVSELRNVHLLREDQLPRQFLVTDTHPSLSKPGHPGEVHLVKPDANLSLDGLVKYIGDTWKRFDSSVDVQIASAYAMTNKNGRLIGHPIQDSVFICYPDNPLKSDKDISAYLEYLRTERFPGTSDRELVVNLSSIAGGVMNEILYTFAYSRGIEGVISHALSTPNEPTIDSILGMGAAGLTPAIVGWIEQIANR